MLVELSLMQYYGIITSLPFSKHASPIFAQRKSNGNLRILIDLRRINHLIRHDYDSHNFPLSSLADVGHHLAGKRLFTKLDCSQAFHVVQMDGLESIQLLAFNFEGRTYAYQRLAQGLSRSVTSFSSFMRKYLDPCIAAGRCFQYVDDVGSAANNVDELVDNLEEIFKCIARSGLKLTMKKCEFGLAKINFLGNTITEQGITPNKEKVEAFLATMKMPKNPKQVKRLIGFLQFFRAFLPNLSLTLIPFYQLLKKGAEFAITAQHRENFLTLKAHLLRATNTYLRLPVADLQYVVVTDASHYGAGYVLMIEDYCKDSTGPDKILAPVSFGSKVFTPAQLKLSIHAKEFLAVYYAFDTFAHLLWGATKKKILVLTDNKALAFFFQAKSIPTSLWNFLDRVMSFPMIIGHIPGNANAAADFLSRMHLDPAQKIEMRLKEPLPMQHIELNITAQQPATCNTLTLADGTEQVAEDDIDEHEMYGEEYPHEARVQDDDNEIAQQNDESPHIFMISRGYTYGLPPTLNSISADNPLDFFDLTHLQAPVEWINEQKKDATIQKVIAWRRLNYVPRLAFYTAEEDKYIKQFPRLKLINGVLCREFYDDAGKISHYQDVVPQHLRDELLYRLHNTKLKGHHGLMKTVAEFRQRFYYPGFTESLINHIKNCLTCVQVKPIPESHRTPPLETMMTDAGLPADALQIDIVGQLSPSAGYKYILTAIDVFSRYLFAVPLRDQSAESTARALVGIFLKHAYIPTTIVTDQGSNFTSAMIRELADLLEIQLKHATVKHPQTVGVVERSHAALKKMLKIFQNATASNWHTFVDYACYSHNTSYHSSIRCAPTMLFHGHDPNTPLDLRYGPARNRRPVTHSKYLTEVSDRMAELHANAKENTIEAYLRFRRYYDKKAKAEPLRLHEYCLLLNPKLTTQNMFAGKNSTKWLALFRVEKVLTNTNYIVRRVGTWYTQLVHRIRLRPFTPTYTVNDLPAINPQKFLPDPDMLKDFQEPQGFDAEMEKLIHDGQPAASAEAMADHPFNYAPLITNAQRMNLPNFPATQNQTSNPPPPPPPPGGGAGAMPLPRLPPDNLQNSRQQTVAPQREHLPPQHLAAPRPLTPAEQHLLTSLPSTSVAPQMVAGPSSAPPQPLMPASPVVPPVTERRYHTRSQIRRRSPRGIESPRPPTPPPVTFPALTTTPYNPINDMVVQAASPPRIRPVDLPTIPEIPLPNAQLDPTAATFVPVAPPLENLAANLPDGGIATPPPMIEPIPLPNILQEETLTLPESSRAPEAPTIPSVIFAEDTPVVPATADSEPSIQQPQAAQCSPEHQPKVHPGWFQSLDPRGIRRSPGPKPLLVQCTTFMANCYPTCNSASLSKYAQQVGCHKPSF